MTEKKPAKTIEPLTPKEEKEFRKNAIPGNPFGGLEVARLLATLDLERTKVEELEAEINRLQGILDSK
jgi:hypothetical protein